MNILQNLKPKAVFKYFEEISNIPRGSGNEEAISNYLLNFGKSLGLESIQDDALNIIIKKPATKGYENAPIVIIQGHMDMVCEKNKGIEHDFEKDPLILINLDNEEEGYLLVSCAGGVRSKATLEVNTQDINNKKLIKINISGLKGGHSGMDIIKERGNSNKILGRVLKGLLREVKYNLVTLSGGSKNNAIPREAEAIISVNENDENTVIEVINNWNDIIQNELRAQDPGVKIEGILINSDENKEFTDECTQKVVDLLYIYPNGINTKSTEIEGLVESSTNLGIVSEKNNVVEFDSAIRSSIPSLKEEIVLRSKTIVELLGGKFETTSDYPGWEYNPDSKIREICQKVHKEMYGEEAKIVAIHAGVECGLFNERLGNLDMISFGPNLYDVHTPDEHMSISSVKNCYEYLLEILKSIK